MYLAYATAFDSDDIHKWSGLGVYYGKMLRECGFTNLNSLNLNERTFPNNYIHSFKINFQSHFFGKNHTPVFDTTQSKTVARIVHNRLDKATHILSPNTVVLAYLKKDLKKILYTDSTLDNLLRFYSNYFNLQAKDITEAQEVERLAIENADLLIYTSKWAADSAIRNYNADATKVFIVPFGANLSIIPTKQELKSIILEKNIKRHINLLFIGVDWKRKGGEYAIELTEKLNELGIPATLHIAGIRNIPLHLNRKFIVYHGFISKRTAKSEMKLCKLYSQSNFLILPSLADCTPVVFSEANAYGVPCLVSSVGGHSGIIKNGINGKTFQHSEFVEKSVKYILELVKSENDYHDLCFSSYEEYLNELNWKSAGNKIAKLINAI